MARMSDWWIPAERPDDSEEGPVTPEIVLLHDVDAALDRLGGRDPDAADLDDPVVALLAEFAADVDLDAPSVDVTRNALTRAGHWPMRQDGSARTNGAGPVTELFRVPASAVAEADAAAAARAQRREWFERQERQGREEGRARQMSALVARPPKVLGLRLLPAVAAATAGVVLSMGAAAALSGAGLTGGVFERMKDLTVGQERSGEQAPGPSAPGVTDASDPAPGSASSGRDPAAASGDPTAVPTPSASLAGALASPAPDDSAVVPTTPVPEPDGLGGDEAVPQLAPPRPADPTTNLGVTTAPPPVAPYPDGGSSSSSSSGSSTSATSTSTTSVKPGNPSPPGLSKRPEKKRP